MPSFLDRLRTTFMSIIAAISRRQRAGTGSSPPATPVLTTIVLSGSSSVVATHTTVFSAAGKDQNGASFGLTPVYASGTPSHSTIGSSSGIATGIAAGTSSITASSVNSLGAPITSNAITLTTAAQVATSPIAVSPSSFNVGAGSTQALTAVVSDQGTPANVIAGATVSWSSGATGVATVNSSTGVVTGVASGSATITATSGSATGTSAATVTGVGPQPQPGSTLFFDSDLQWSSYTTVGQMLGWFNSYDQGTGTWAYTGNYDGSNTKALRADYPSYVTSAINQSGGITTTGVSQQVTLTNTTYVTTGHNVVLDANNGAQEEGCNVTAISGNQVTITPTKTHSNGAPVGIDSDSPAYLDTFKTMSPNPTEVYIEYTMHPGKTATGGGLPSSGGIGQFEYNNTVAQTPAGAKILLALRPSSDPTNSERFYLVFPGPTPGSLHIQRDGGYSGDVDLNPNMNLPAPTVASLVGQTNVIAWHLKAESVLNAADGVVELWVNGVQYFDYTNVKTGTAPWYQVQQPSTFRSPKYDQSLYIVRLRAWTP